VVTVWSPQAYELREALVGPDVTVTSSRAGELEVHGLTAEQIGDIAFDNRVRVHQLSMREASLEEAFMELTRDAVEYHAHTSGEAPATEQLSSAVTTGDRR